MNLILVTGSSGQLGRTLVARLVQQGYSVRGIDRTPSPTTHQLVDIREADAVREACRSCGAVVHTAALHGLHAAQGYPRQAFIDTNITGTLNLLNACQSLGIGTFVFTSTTSVYGKAMLHADQAVWVDEHLTPQPRDIYDITKLAAEQLCADFCEKESLPVRVIRIARFLDEAPNDLANYRLYRGLDVRDGALAHQLALEKNLPGFHLFNISAYSPFQPQDLTALRQNPAPVIRRYFPQVDALYAQRGWQLPLSIDRVYVTAKAQALLGYRPHFNFEEYVASVRF